MKPVFYDMCGQCEHVSFVILAGCQHTQFQYHFLLLPQNLPLPGQDLFELPVRTHLLPELG